MSLYEHIVRTNEKETSKVLPNPMNAMRSDPDVSLKSLVFSLFLWSQIILFLFFIAYLLYGTFLSNIEQRSQEKAAQILSEKNQSEALLSQIYKDSPAHNALSFSPDFETVLVDDHASSSSHTLGHNSVQADREELSWLGKNPGVETFTADNSDALKASVATHPAPSHVNNLLSEKLTVQEQAVPAPPPTVPQAKIEGGFKLDTSDSKPVQDMAAVKKRAQALWQKALSSSSSMPLQEAVKLVGAEGFPEFFSEKLPVISQEKWITVEEFCHASIHALEKDKDRDQVVLTCSDYFTDRGEMPQALALYSYKPSMQTHQDFYSRMAYVALKNEKFSQASSLYHRLLELDPKNARWWLGLGWALRGQGDTKLAHEAYAKAYKYALPGAEFKPFLQSVLQNG